MSAELCRDWRLKSTMWAKSSLHDGAMTKKTLDTNIVGIDLHLAVRSVVVGEVMLSYPHGEQTIGRSMFGSVLDSILCLSSFG